MSWRRVPPWTLVAPLAVVYLILSPQSPDLAAASYRSYLFSQHGFTLWDNSWYGGHHLPAYSLLAPALGALLGPSLLAALAMVAATWLFEALARGAGYPARARTIATLWFAFGAGVALLSSRVPFDLGLAIGLGAVVLFQRGRPVAALAASVLCAVASPVAGAFLGMGMLARALTAPRRGWPVALAIAALAPIGLLSLLFPEGGSQPFVASAFYPALAGVLALAALTPPEQRTLRVGAWLYALAMTGSYLLPTAVGGNADRLGALAAGPALALALAGGGRRRLQLLAILALPFAYWQANAPVTDFVSTVDNPGVNASYYAPLLGELRRLGIGYGRRPARIEVVPTVDHWEARYVAPETMIARGWERQLDGYRNGLFYASRLTAARYRDWLSQQAISYVALPDASLDYSGKAEARLVRSGVAPFLHEVWRSAHWRLFAVEDPTPLVEPPARLEALGTDSFTVRAPAAGSYTVKLHFTPYWAVSGPTPGCVVRAPGEWTSVRARRAGALRVTISFSPARIFSQGPRCD